MQRQRLILDRRQLTLDYEAGCLIIRHPDDSPRTLPIERIRQVICMHGVQLSSHVLGQFRHRQIDFVVLNLRHADHSVALYGDGARQQQRRLVQYQWQCDPESALPLAVSLCRHRLQRAIRCLLQYEHPATLDCARSLPLARAAMLEATTLEQLRGLEGQAQAQVFDAWRQLLPSGLGFVRRQRQPPPDPVNGLLSLTYSLVYQEAVRACLMTGLDGQLGCYHRLLAGRESLACDVMEPLRPDIESWVVQLFLQGVVAKRQFTRSKAGQACLLGKEARVIFYQALAKVQPSWWRQLQATTRWLCRRMA